MREKRTAGHRARKRLKGRGKLAAGDGGGKRIFDFRLGKGENFTEGRLAFICFSFFFGPLLRGGFGAHHDGFSIYKERQGKNLP